MVGFLRLAKFQKGASTMTNEEAEKRARKFFGKDWGELTEKQKQEAIQAVMDGYNQGYRDAKGGREN